MCLAAGVVVWLDSAQDLVQTQAAELQELRETFQEVVAANASLKQEIEALKEKARFARITIMLCYISHCADSVCTTHDTALSYAVRMWGVDKT